MNINFNIKDDLIKETTYKDAGVGLFVYNGDLFYREKRTSSAIMVGTTIKFNEYVLTIKTYDGKTYKNIGDIPVYKILHNKNQ